MQKITALAELYFDLKRTVLEHGFASEIDWQSEVKFDSLSESMFLEQCAWVIVSSGFSYTSTCKIFPDLCNAFYDFESAIRIVRNRPRCTIVSLKFFNNHKKVEAIIGVAERVHRLGFDAVKQRLKDDPLNFLVELPFIGPVTMYHLAKNIGADIAKPDRHLMRISKAVGYSDPQSMCKDLSTLVGEKIAVIDIVLWRYATINRDYVNTFTALA